MASQIFVNLPVKDLKASITFFKALGYKFDKRFTDDTATCMIVSDTIFVMLLTHAKFKMFTKKRIIDAAKSVEVLLALHVESRKAVDTMIKKAVKAGGTSPKPAVDLGFMYQSSFEDLDGHTWEIFHMADIPA